MKAFITGAAGFIGSNLTDKLLSLGVEVIGYDNLSTGKKEFLQQAFQHDKFKLITSDLLDLDSISSAIEGCDIVFHLAANADIKDGLKHPFKDLEQNTIVTYNVLEAMRKNNIKKIVFSSTGSVYGEAQIIPTPENASFPIQTSLYGASKVACEGLIQAYCEGYGIQSWIFRFVSILGERYTHGHVFDFCQSLQKDDTNLLVLGNGKQKKSYLYVQDCIKAILIALERAKERVNIFNLGTDEYCQVTDSIHWITKHMNVSPKLKFTGGDRGWVGDNPFIFLDCQKIRDLGWQPEVTIREGIIKTLEYLQKNSWLTKSR